MFCGYLYPRIENALVIYRNFSCLNIFFDYYITFLTWKSSLKNLRIICFILPIADTKVDRCTRKNFSQTMQKILVNRNVFVYNVNT